MGFAAIARVTQHRWIACEVRDEIQFGLKPGGELKVETTICNEIRNHHKAVIIDHVDKCEAYSWNDDADHGLITQIKLILLNPGLIYIVQFFLCLERV